MGGSCHCSTTCSLPHDSTTASASWVDAGHSDVSKLVLYDRLKKHSIENGVIKRMLQGWQLQNVRVLRLCNIKAQRESVNGPFPGWRSRSNGEGTGQQHAPSSRIMHWPMCAVLTTLAHWTSSRTLNFLAAAYQIPLAPDCPMHHLSFLGLMIPLIPLLPPAAQREMPHHSQLLERNCHVSMLRQTLRGLVGLLQ